MFLYCFTKQHVDLNSLNLILVQLELCVTAYVAHRANRLQTPRRLIEELPANYVPPPRCPNGRLRLYVRVHDARAAHQIGHTALNAVKVGTSPAIKIESLPALQANRILSQSQQLNRRTATTVAAATKASVANSTVVGLARGSTSAANAVISVQPTTNVNLRKRPEPGARVPTAALTVPNTVNRTIQSAQATISTITTKRNGLPAVTSSGSATSSSSAVSATSSSLPPKPRVVAEGLAIQLKNHSYAAAAAVPVDNAPTVDATVSAFTLEHIDRIRRDRRTNRLQFLGRVNRRRCDATPIYGADLRETIVRMCTRCEPNDAARGAPYSCQHDVNVRLAQHYAGAIKSVAQRTAEMSPVFSNFVIYVPAVSAPLPALHVSHANPSRRAAEERSVVRLEAEMGARMRVLHPIVSAMNTQFPDPRLIQYDCGKLQTLDRLLRQLKVGSHRVLIFTQMTRMLDILEAFLNYHGHIYLRLDGTTKVEQRQVLMDRFNNDRRIFVFILSTRSGGVGVNLTGADTVVFYDSDWNPTMDAQAQDRCHRIGQTRDVHIYRLVSEKTIEENILKKANQKRMLGNLAIEGGNFTTEYFRSSTIQDLFVVDTPAAVASASTTSAAATVARPTPSIESMDTSDNDVTVAPTTTDISTNAGAAAAATIDDLNAAPGELESALAAAEDEQDVQAAKIASAEAVAELDEFDETIPIEEATSDRTVTATGVEMSKAEQDVENMVQQVWIGKGI